MWDSKQVTEVDDFRHKGMIWFLSRLLRLLTSDPVVVEKELVWWRKDRRSLQNDIGDRQLRGTEMFDEDKEKEPRGHADKRVHHAPDRQAE